MITAAVAAAVAAVRDHFAGHPVEAVPDGAGGAFITVDHVQIGGSYTPSSTWLGFQINAAYPASDVYPHYIGRVARVDGRPHGQAITVVDWRERPALQLSRRSNRWRPGTDNAPLKAEKVLTWLASL